MLCPLLESSVAGQGNRMNAVVVHVNLWFSDVQDLPSESTFSRATGARQA
jgi:hypothetical protein